MCLLLLLPNGRQGNKPKQVRNQRMLREWPKCLRARAGERAEVRASQVTPLPPANWRLTGPMRNCLGLVSMIWRYQNLGTESPLLCRPLGLASQVLVWSCTMNTSTWRSVSHLRRRGLKAALTWRCHVASIFVCKFGFITIYVGDPMVCFVALIPVDRWTPRVVWPFLGIALKARRILWFAMRGHKPKSWQGGKRPGCVCVCLCILYVHVHAVHVNGTSNYNICVLTERTITCTILGAVLCQVWSSWRCPRSLCEHAVQPALNQLGHDGDLKGKPLHPSTSQNW